MSIHTIIRSPGALCLGVFFACVTSRVILDDVWNGAPVTLSHVNSVAALIGAIASGHMAWPQLKRCRLAGFFGLAIIFVSATGYIVISSGARNAEAMQAKASLIVKTNEERQEARLKLNDAEADLLDAKAAYDTAKGDAARECGTGKKTKCEGREAVRDNAAKDLEKAESHAALMRGKLEYIGPEQTVNGGYKHASRVFESMGFGKADAIESRLILVMPFLTVLISEIGTLTFLGMAMGKGPSIPGNSPTIPNKPKPSGKRGRKSDQRVIQFSDRFSRKHGRPPTGGEIKGQFPEIPKSTAYDYASRRVLKVV
jgi:hypothetical protein